MVDISDALTARIDAMEDATEAFRAAAFDYHALADTRTGTTTQLDAETEHVVDAWLHLERERKQLDAVVRDIGATFRVAVQDADGRTESTTITPGTVSGLLQATYGNIRNITELDPHPRYTEDDAATLLATFDSEYTTLAAADRAYVETLDIIASYDPLIETKQERAGRESTLDTPYRELDRVLTRRTEA